MSKLPYYDYSKLMSRNGVFNFIVGGRGIGKTFGAKRMAINHYLNKGEQFIYLRRYKTDLMNKETFFSDIEYLYDDIQFRVNGNQAEMKRLEGNDKAKWEVIGYFINLSTAGSRKSVAFPKVTLIIFDEFIIDKGAVRYLPNEDQTFFEFYSTVDRWQDKTKVLFLANAISMINPYFIRWDIHPQGSEWITAGDGFIVCHFPKGDTFADVVSRTRFGEFLNNNDPSYAEYATGSEFRDEHPGLIETKQPPNSEPSYKIVNGNDMITIYRYTLSSEAGLGLYVSDKDINVRNVMTSNAKYIDKDMPLIPQSIVNIFRQMYNAGKVTFRTPQCRHMFELLIKP